MKNYLFIVEGVQDIAVLAKYFKLNGYQKIEEEKDVPPIWKKFIPNIFPHNGKILQRVPVPTFFKSDDKSIAVYSANGDANILNTINATLSVLLDDELSAIGILCDADSKDAKTRYDGLMKVFEKNLENDLKHFIEDHSFCKISQNENCKFGVYVFPDNQSSGVLEDLLIEGAQYGYQEILHHADVYLQQVEKESLSYIDFKSLTGSSRKKAIVGVIANVLKPGSSNQVSIERNNWLNEDLLLEKGSYQNKFKNFLDEILV